jgi:hypothetical protein
MEIGVTAFCKTMVLYRNAHTKIDGANNRNAGPTPIMPYPV